MSNIYLEYVGQSGQALLGTVERLSDNYYREDESETFASGLVFTDKDIVMIEGSTDNRGTYRTTVDGTTWQEGLYTFRAHVSGTNIVLGEQSFGVRDGYEYNLGQDHTADNVYYADITLVRDTSNATDEYSVSWFKNGVPITSGITSPLIKVTKRADGTDLVSEVAMSEVGSTHVFKKDEVSNRTSRGETYIAQARATIDSAVRAWRKMLTRDN
jgi:hypothetical protein